MKFLKEILNVWKRNLVPAIIGLAPLVAVVILLPVWNPSLNVRTNLLIPGLRAAAKIGGTEQSGHLPEHALSCLKREKVARTLFPTLLALKLYRSQTGNYPERLEALVPELLPALPLDPETGEAFPYTRTPDGFTLSYRNGKHTITTGSKPDY